MCSWKPMWTLFWWTLKELDSNLSAGRPFPLRSSTAAHQPGGLFHQKDSNKDFSFASTWAARRPTEHMQSASWLDSGLTSGRIGEWDWDGKPFKGKLAEGGVLEILVQPAPQSQNEGYHGGSSNSFLINLGPSSDLFNFQLDPLGLMDPLGECPAVEVFKFRDKDGFFGQVGFLPAETKSAKNVLGSGYTPSIMIFAICCLYIFSDYF